jgi:hypothetical protein
MQLKYGYALTPIAVEVLDSVSLLHRTLLLWFHEL